MRCLDPRDLCSRLSRDEALNIARDRYGRAFKSEQRKPRETEPSAKLVELQQAKPVILVEGRK